MEHVQVKEGVTNSKKKYKIIIEGDPESSLASLPDIKLHASVESMLPRRCRLAAFHQNHDQH